MRLPNLITKRDGTVVPFQTEKITRAIEKAGIQTGEFNISEAERLTQEVLELVEHYDDYDNLTVERVQDLVEIALLGSKHKATAKAYILYREWRNQARRPDIFKFRFNLKPYEYPELAEFKEAIQHSYWLHTEFNTYTFKQDKEGKWLNEPIDENNHIIDALRYSMERYHLKTTVKLFKGGL